MIVGGGPMGTAAARALSARGRAVILLERFTLGHARGSTAGTDPQLPPHVPRSSLCPDGEALVGAMAGAGGRGRRGAVASGGRARRRRGDRGVGTSPRARRRAPRAPVGRRGRGALAHAPLPAALVLRVPARRGGPAFPGGGSNHRPTGDRARCGASGGDGGGVDRRERGRRRGGDGVEHDPGAGGDRGSRRVVRLAPGASGDPTDAATDPRAVDVLRRGRQRTCPP